MTNSVPLPEIYKRPFLDSNGNDLEENKNYRITVLDKLLPEIRDPIIKKTGADGSLFTVKKIEVDAYLQSELNTYNLNALCQRADGEEVWIENTIFIFTPEN